MRQLALAHRANAACQTAQDCATRCRGGRVLGRQGLQTLHAGDALAVVVDVELHLSFVDGRDRGAVVVCLLVERGRLQAHVSGLLLHQL